MVIALSADPGLLTPLTQTSVELKKAVAAQSVSDEFRTKVGQVSSGSSSRGFLVKFPTTVAARYKS
jgi:hypothetical protein